MKKIIICAMILIISAQSFSQEIVRSQSLTSKEFLLKSKRQAGAGWAILTGGAVFTAIVVLSPIEHTGTGYDVFGGGSFTYTTHEVNRGLLKIGMGIMASSIPFFVSSIKNKKRSLRATTSFKMETAPMIQRSSFVQTSFPAVSVKINF